MNFFMIIFLSKFYLFVKTLGTLRKGMPLWDRSLYASLCIEVLLPKDSAETVVAVVVTIIVVRIECSTIRSIIVIASTFEERIA